MNIVTASLTGGNTSLPSEYGHNQEPCSMQQSAFRQTHLSECCLRHMRCSLSAVPTSAAMYPIFVTSCADSANSTLAHQICEPTSKKVDVAWMMMTCNLADLQTGSC